MARRRVYAMASLRRTLERPAYLKRSFGLISTVETFVWSQEAEMR
jgi:hypothetical protein